MKGLKFKCKLKKSKTVEEWPAEITRFVNHGSHYEITISSRSSINVIFGGTQNGGFCCIPDWKAGCELAGYEDINWNYERLQASMKNKVDAITVAYALAAIGQTLNKVVAQCSTM